MNDHIRYTDAVDKFYFNMDNYINSNIFQNKQIYMFGSSKVAAMIISYLKNNGINVDGIVNNNPKTVGTKFLELPIYSPEILRNMDKNNTVVLIASGYQDSMIAQLEEMEYQLNKNIIKIIDLPELMQDYSFVDRTGYELLSWEDVKASQMRVLRGVKQICEENNLRYYLAYGTLIGAIRHKGYIPWDDDIDVYMNINDLEKFISIVDRSQDYGIASIASDSDYFDIIAVMYDRNNICDTNHFPIQLSAGVTIDIFPLFGLPEDRTELESYYHELKSAELDMLSHLYNKEECNVIRKKFFDLLKKYDVDTSKYIGYIMGASNYKEIYPTEWFGEGTDVFFEGEIFRAPNNYDANLRAVFGDYMQLPPEEQRQGHHFFHAYKKM